MQDVECKGGEFGPQGEPKPEVGVKRDGEEKAESEAKESGGDNVAKRHEMGATDEEVESVSTHEEGDLRAENDTGGGQDDKGSLIAPLGGLSSKRDLGAREKITQG